MKNKETGNQIVDAMARIDITGNVIPARWFKTLLDAKGKPYYLAILILAEIVYWYRPSIKNDESGKQTTYKKFKADLFQLSYVQIKERLGIEHKRAQYALKYLENLGIIWREFRTINTSYNVMFIGLRPEVLYNYTFEDNADTLVDNDHTHGPNRPYLWSDMTRPMVDNDQTNGHTCPDLRADTTIPVVDNDQTNTKNTPQINAKNTSQTNSATTTTGGSENSKDISGIDDDVLRVLKKYSLNNKDIEAIKNCAKGDNSVIRKALEALEPQPNTVTSIVGWLISAIKNDYEPPKTKNQKKKNDKWGNFAVEHNYDYDQIAEDIVNR